VLLVDVRDADVLDLSFLLERDECARRLLVGNVLVGSVQLVQRNPVEAETPQAPFARRFQMLGTRVVRPAVGSGAFEAALRRDDEVVRIGIQRLRDEVLVTCGPYESAVSKLRRLDGPSQDGFGFVAVGGFTPDPRLVRRIEPNPRRFTTRSPPMTIVPACAAEMSLIPSPLPCAWRTARRVAQTGGDQI
jgi:hypothetical protein